MCHFIKTSPDTSAHSLIGKTYEQMEADKAKLAGDALLKQTREAIIEVLEAGYTAVLEKGETRISLSPQKKETHA